MKVKSITILFCVLLLSGCATKQNRDPWESYNRAIFKFNKVAYDYALVPFSKGYNDVVPAVVQTGISNVYNNILEPGRVINDLLQLNFSYAWRDTTRFVANTIWGVFGLVDVAKEINLPRRRQNFGFTLAKWGYRYSPFFVIPILGPNTIGGTAGILVDSTFNPLSYAGFVPSDASIVFSGVANVNNSVPGLLLYDKLSKNSFDLYVAMRNGYLQNYDYGLEKTLGILNQSNARQSEKSDAEVLVLLGKQLGS